MQKVTKARQRMEKTILGTFLVEPAAYFEVSTELCSDMFSQERKLVAQELFLTLDEKGDVDINNFAYQVSKGGEVDDDYIHDLIQFSSKGSLIGFCAELKQLYFNELELSLAEKTIARIQGGENSENVLLEVSAERDLVHESLEKLEDTRLNDLMEVYDNAVAAVENEGALTGIPTGLKEIDEITNGWQLTDMNVVAARPAMGKSYYGFGLAKESAMHGHPAGIVSLEMSRVQVYRRLVSMGTQIPVDRIRSGKLTESELNAIHEEVQKIHALPLYVEDTLTHIDKIINRLRVWKRKYKLEMVVLDYLQLASVTSDKGDTERVSEISRKLKMVSGRGDCNISMIALAQLNRDLEKRGDKRPQLSDLRNSGQIEQDADLIIFIYRDEYYGITETKSGESTRNVAELIVGKNRHGKLGTAVVGFQGRFYDTGIPF